MEKIPKIKIISLGETALSTIEKEIITHENISIITIKNDYKDLKINFQDTDVILIILNTYFENDKNFALEIIKNTGKNDIFTGIYDIGNGYTDLFDSKIFYKFYFYQKFPALVLGFVGNHQKFLNFLFQKLRKILRFFEIQFLSPLNQE